MNTVVADLRTHLPYARRFARALCGSQASGDAYIIQTLEALVADRSILDQYDSSKKALYATFLKLWNSIAVNSATETSVEDPSVASADRNLQALPAQPRQAFLLVSLEGFTIPETAQVLGIGVDEVNALID